MPNVVDGHLMGFLVVCHKETFPAVQEVVDDGMLDVVTLIPGARCCTLESENRESTEDSSSIADTRSSKSIDQRPLGKVQWT
jgi:hypothetical protein